MDKISIKGLRLFAYHGVNPEEKENGQTTLFDEGNNDKIMKEADNSQGEGEE